MLNALRSSIVALLAFTAITGVAYPLALTGLRALAFDVPAEQARSRIAQGTVDPAWFWARPSAASYQTLPSGASNLAPSNRKLREQADSLRKAWVSAGGASDSIEPELLTASGSGLDSDLSPAGARAQVPRICRARSWDAGRCERLMAWVAESTEGATWGFLGRERVNVNRINQKLAAESGMGK